MRRVMMAAALFQGATATAQQAVQTRRTFTPSDFERFAPQTALDMVRQIPGFEIEREDNNRGFGQASGNVLINSRRLSGKSNDAVDALGRIPADNVVEIRLVDGATLEIPGLSGQVVDVITNGSKFSGAWEWQGRLRERLEPNFETFEASITGNTGQFEWTLGIENRPNRSGNAGPEIL
ncbi:MAG: Plug domain-containing protein, partial [Pseudomonadota bacterium]